MICGIDPGYDRLGIALVSGNGSQPVHEHSECFTPPTKDFFDSLFACGTRVAELLDTYKPEAIALETLFITKNQKTAMHVAELRGVILYEARKRTIPIFEYSPPHIKLAVTGYGASDKKAVETMLKRLIRLPDRIMIDDEYDAIAVAITHLANTRSTR
jgi:crossover junction endodeoxyribonuclease RuvC